ncbi:ABC transporter permease [Haloferax larsenii]|uniref:Putative ABC transport system permease protein n=1 Tax=Haloferax larsenii TaxID=302484 RepID=A0A1H7VCI2_HALLR|nr:ABC transporter permease [Haloferax larsenii]SEM06972.1 putative ABC transport system permease protein [Haloferax larsenii]
MSRRLQRLAGVIRLGLARFTGRLFGGDSRQLWSSIAGVAFAVMLMTTVGGIGLGLASQSAIESEGVDYWVVPEAGSASAIAVSVDAPRLGGVHSVANKLNARSDVDYATPVLLHVTRIENPRTEASEYVLLVGVVGDGSNQSILGLPTTPLTPGDPYYADGDYDGPWTGEVVLSDAAATLLDVKKGEKIAPATAPNETLSVATISESNYATGGGPISIGVVHLSEAQELAGATNGDQADQILVSTNNGAVRKEIESLYPGTEVVTQSGFAQQQASNSSLSLAIAIGGVVTAFVVGSLFVATLMGLEILSQTESFATLAAIGYSTRSRALLVLIETLSVTLLGGAIGLLFGLGGIELANYLGETYLGVSPVALFDPVLVGAAAVVALLIGATASVYPIWLSRRSNPLEVLQ